MKSRLLLISVLLLFGLTASAQSWVWGTEATVINKYGTGEGWSVASDASGNSYLAGYFGDTISFGSFHLMTANGGSVFIVKFDSAGNVLWAKQPLNASKLYSSSQANSVTTDAQGNVYVTGLFEDSVSFGSFILQTTNATPFLVKYDNNGNVLWAVQAALPSRYSYGFGNAVTTDKTGNTYITGNYNDTLNFGAYSLKAKKSFGIFYAKYDVNGNLLWAKQPVIDRSNGEDYPHSIATDDFNTIYITGYFDDTVTFGTTSLITPPFQETEIFTVKLDSNGNDIWAQQSVSHNLYSPPLTVVRGYGIYLDKESNSYITGTFYDTISFGSYKLETQNFQNIYLVKYDINGNVIWAKTSNVLKSDNHSFWAGFDVVMDTLNHLYLSCGDYGFNLTKDNEIVFGTDTFTINNTSLDGCSLILKLDTSGNVICGVGVPGGGDDNNGIAVDLAGKYLYFGGDLYTAIRFGPDSLLQQGQAEIPFMAKWQPCSSCNLAVTVSPQSPSICNGQSVTLTASGEPNYTWNPSTGLNTTTGSSVVITDTSTTTYTIVGTGGCNTDTTQVVVTIIPSPNKPTITKQGDVLTSSATQGNQWMVNDTTIQGATNQSYSVTKPDCYSITVINPANGCSATSDTTCVLEITTGINLSINNTQLSIYPNPTTGQFTITTNGNQNGYTIEIINVLGQTVLKAPLGDLGVINLSSSPAGLYFLYLKSDECVKVGKVLVTK